MDADYLFKRKTEANDFSLPWSVWGAFGTQRYPRSIRFSRLCRTSICTADWNWNYRATEVVATAPLLLILRKNMSPNDTRLWCERRICGDRCPCFQQTSYEWQNDGNFTLTSPPSRCILTRPHCVLRLSRALPFPARCQLSPCLRTALFISCTDWDRNNVE